MNITEDYSEDEKYMAMAIELAKKGYGYTAPNPVVGAVIVKDGCMIGQGYHEKYGEPHAERNALASCTQSPKGATIYVTLEPCCHHGKQPPCTEAILQAGISRVVTGSGDPNPLVGGKGIQILKDHGIQVREHVMKEKCDALNQAFFHYIQTGRPYVTMKYAMTIDGKIAAYTGASKWVTGEEARYHVHEQRKKNTAIMVGIGTVLADDPMLNCRIEGGRDPVRIICDTHLKMPVTSKIVKTAKDIPTIIACCTADEELQRPYREAGCKILLTEKKMNHIDLDQLMEQLGKEKIDSILLEGGGTLNWAALNAGIVQKIQAYIAPKIFGGTTAKTPVEGIGVEVPDQAFLIKNRTIRLLGEDLLVEGDVERNVYRDY